MNLASGFALFLLAILIFGNDARPTQKPTPQITCSIYIYYYKLDRESGLYVERDYVLAKGIIKRIQNNKIQVDFRDFIVDNKLKFKLNERIKILPLHQCQIKGA